VEYIEWYDNIKNKTRKWQIQYTVLNGIVAKGATDSLAWPVFSSYDSWIDSLTLNISLYKKIPLKNLTINASRSGGTKLTQTVSSDGRNITIKGSNFFPREQMNISLGFLKIIYPCRNRQLLRFHLKIEPQRQPKLKKYL